MQAVLAGVWLLLEPPAVAHVYPSRTRNVLVCQGSDGASYLVGLLYPSLLIGVCTVYAFKTRKCPEGFNEARHLAFANYTTCVIWLAFLPLFLLSGSPTIRTLALSFLLSLSGAVQTGCLFVPKVYVALCKPAKNTREGVMGHHYHGRCLNACGNLALNNLTKADNNLNVPPNPPRPEPQRGQSKTL